MSGHLGRFSAPTPHYNRAQNQNDILPFYGFTEDKISGIVQSVPTQGIAAGKQRRYTPRVFALYVAEAKHTALEKGGV